ncbi:hypothetical protein acdb102_14690 [Acidothermaceae bacterium B102]|nr:hypothetical protein acdb102_14690 [Acidothermaceae bacterium B102]
MTESSGADAHLGLDRLADLEEGLLTPAEEQAARDHLAGCEICQEDAAALAAVHAALLDDAEVPMPADIADRLYAALGELPALTPPVAAVTTLPARSGPSAWERRRKPVLITLAAAAAVTLLTLGVIHLPRSQGSSASSAAGVTSAAAAAAGPQILHSGHNYTAAGLGPDGAALVGGATAGATSGAAAATEAAAAATSAAAAAPTSAAAAASSAAAAGGATSAAAATAAAATSAGTSAAAATSAAGSGVAAPPKTPANAGASSPAGTSVPAAPAATTDALGPLRAPDAAQRCIALLLQTSVPPLVIDFATFNGKPAVIGVVPDPQDPTKLAVIAVGPPACSLYSLNYVPKP